MINGLLFPSPHTPVSRFVPKGSPCAAGRNSYEVGCLLQCEIDSFDASERLAMELERDLLTAPHKVLLHELERNSIIGERCNHRGERAAVHLREVEIAEITLPGTPIVRERDTRY